MSKSEIFCKRHAKRSDEGSIGFSTAGGITGADVAAACYKLSSLDDNLVMAKHGDKSALDKLLRSKWCIDKDGLCKEREGGGDFDEAFQQTLILAIDRRWQKVGKGQDRLRKLTVLAITNAITKPVCTTCGGTKYQDINLCAACKGAGHKKMNAAQVARDLGIAKSTFKESWEYKYNDIVAMIESMIVKAENKTCL